MSGWAQEEVKTADLGDRRLNERLGIVPQGPDHVKLRDDAPLTSLRRAMF